MLNILKISMNVPQNTKTTAFLLCTYCTSDTYPKDSKTAYSRELCIDNFSEKLFTRAKLQNQPRCQLVHKCTMKTWCTCK